MYITICEKCGKRCDTKEYDRQLGSNCCVANTIDILEETITAIQMQAKVNQLEPYVSGSLHLAKQIDDFCEWRATKVEQQRLSAGNAYCKEPAEGCYELIYLNENNTPKKKRFSGAKNDKEAIKRMNEWIGNRNVLTTFLELWKITENKILIKYS